MCYSDAARAFDAMGAASNLTKMEVLPLSYHALSYHALPRCPQYFQYTGS